MSLLITHYNELLLVYMDWSMHGQLSIEAHGQLSMHWQSIFHRALWTIVSMDNCPCYGQLSIDPQIVHRLFIVWTIYGQSVIYGQLSILSGQLSMYGQLIVHARTIVHRTLWTIVHIMDNCPLSMSIYTNYCRSSLNLIWEQGSFNSIARLAVLLDNLLSVGQFGHTAYGIRHKAKISEIGQKCAKLFNGWTVLCPTVQGWTVLCPTVQWLDSAVSNFPMVGRCCVQLSND